MKSDTDVRSPKNPKIIVHAHVGDGPRNIPGGVIASVVWPNEPYTRSKLILQGFCAAGTKGETEADER